MKAILEFNTPEERPELDLALGAGEMFSALVEIREAIRSKLKYGEPNEETREILEHLRGLLPWELMDRIP